MKLHFVTFYTTGSNQIGADLTNAESSLRSLVKPFVDSYQAYTPQLVKDMGGGEHVKNYGNGQFLQLNPGLHEIGMGKYKPWIILEEMKKMQQGDVLVYKDVNHHKYPQYRTGLDKLRETSSKILELVGTDTFMPIDPSMRDLVQHAKADMILHYMPSVPSIAEFPLLIANVIIVRKSATSVAMMNEWMQLMSDHEDWILPNPHPNRLPRFEWLTPEQAVFAALVAQKIQKGIFPSGYPFYTLRDRVLSIDALQKVR